MAEGTRKARRSARALAALSTAVALTGASVAQAVPSGHGAVGRSCGTQTYRSHGVSSTTRVRVLKGTVSCKTARKVFRDLVAGKGTHHEKPGQGMAGVTVSVDGWTCGYFAGGEACNRGPAKHPTAQIRQIDASLPDA